MPQIRFSQNWNNKLDGKVFTTIRSFNPEKMDYYQKNVEKVFTVMLNNKTYCSARLRAVYVENVADIPVLYLYLDTGRTHLPDILELFHRFGVKDKVLILLFEKAYPDQFTVLQEDNGDD